ncbi:MAG: hypothetical protein JXB34_07300 [Bacteroidales bacterium]|nr:hypothetical protein [Bacteroidales bacterium]
MGRFFCFSLIFVALFGNINAQIKNIGAYSITNYSVYDNELIASTNAILQNNEGIMFFGNNKGINIFDGINWQLIKLPNNSGVYSLAAGSDGKIYLGAMDEFGYLQPSADGKLGYVSLMPKLPEEYTGIGNVTNVFQVPEGVLFVTNNELILFSNNTCKVIEPVKTNGPAIYVDNKILINQELKALKTYSNGKLHHFIESENIDFSKVLAVIKWKANSLLAIDNENGCFVMEHGIAPRMIQAPFSGFALKNKIISSLTLRNGYTVLGSMLNGALIIDSLGNPVQFLNKGNGLGNNKIISLYEDNCGNLWIGHDVGVSYIETSSPFTNLFPYEQGNGIAARLFNRKLYLGTSQGLFFIEQNDLKNVAEKNNQVTRVNNIAGQTWNLEVIDNNLYACNNDGTFIINGNKATKCESRIGTWGFLPLPGKKNMYLQGTYSGFNLFELNGGLLTFKHQMEGFYLSSRVFEFDDRGFVWVTHGYNGVYRLKIDSSFKSFSNIRYYGQPNGFPSNLGINVYKINNQILFSSEHGGIYEYNQAKDSFELFTGFEKYIGKTPGTSKLYQDTQGNIWFIGMERTGKLLKSDSGYAWLEKPFSNLSKLQIRGFELIYPIDSGNVILGTTKGFLHYSPEIKKNYSMPFFSIIRSVEILSAKDSLIYEGYMPPDKKNIKFHAELPHKFNSLRFSYVAPFFENIKEVEYSCLLEGFDKTWSEWGYKTEREYTNLPGGNYTFCVRAKNIYGTVSTTGTYSFYVAPHFTRTWAAYIVYLLLFVVLLIGLVYLYSRKKVARYRKEAILKEREIIQLRNKQLNSEIEFKNKELGSMTMHMIKRKEILLNIKNKLDEVYPNLPPDVKNAISLILKSIDREINIDQDWEFIKVNFDSVYIGFLKKLKELFPELRSSELQLCAYIRMGLSNKEIATIMNSTIRGVEGYRYRLRKNLNLCHDENIKDFLFNLIQ